MKSSKNGWSLHILLFIGITLLIVISFNLLTTTERQFLAAPKYLSKGLTKLNSPTKASEAPETNKQNGNTQNELAILAAKKAINNKLIISIVDSAYIEMALNLWETSFVKFGITNYLFICMDKQVKSLLPPGADDCFVATEDKDGERASSFGSAAFNRKVMVKTKISLDLLYLGFHIIVVDLDIVFLQNPLPHLVCNDCDLVIEDNYQGELNSGFYMIKPTRAAIELQKQSVEEASKPGHTNDQNIMNKLVNSLKQTHNLKVVLLDYYLFQSGRLFFSDKRNFVDELDCENCVIVHNNWIVGVRNKIYRFKEMLMWVVDTDGYYTSTVNKYLTYSNPGDSNRDQERKALELAFQVGKLLNRSVILPQFNCKDRPPSKRCHLLKAFGAGYLESKQESTYRESVFLQHPKVPELTKSSISQGIDAEVLIKNTNQSTLGLAERISDGIKSNQTLNNFKVIRFRTLIF